MASVSALDPQIAAALKASYEALREMAAYTLEPSISELMLDLGERKEFLDEAQHTDLMALVHLTQRLTLEKLRAEVALERIEAVCPEVRSGSAVARSPETHLPDPVPDAVSSGVSKSQAALRRELPALLANEKVFHWWVAYHGDERVGVARTKIELIAECLRRGLAHDECYVAWIDESELVEEEEVQFGLAEFDDDTDPATP